MYCIYGAEEVDVFINFMFNVLLSNGYGIPFIFIFNLSTYKWAGATVALCVGNRNTVTEAEGI